MISWQQIKLNNIIIYPYIINPLCVAILPISNTLTQNNTYLTFIKMLQVLLLAEHEICKVYYSNENIDWDIIIATLIPYTTPKYWLAFGFPYDCSHNNVVHIPHPEELNTSNRKQAYQTLINCQQWLRKS